MFGIHKKKSVTSGKTGRQTHKDNLIEISTDSTIKDLKQKIINEHNNYFIKKRGYSINKDGIDLFKGELKCKKNENGKCEKDEKGNIISDKDNTNKCNPKDGPFEDDKTIKEIGLKNEDTIYIVYKGNPLLANKMLNETRGQVTKIGNTRKKRGFTKNRKTIKKGITKKHITK